MRRRWTGPTVGVGVLVALAGWVAASSGPQGHGAPGAPGPPGVDGVVVDEAGRAVRGAAVSSAAGGSARTDAQGRFSLDVRRSALVTARADGYLPRTQAVEPGTPTTVRLTSSAAETVSLRFGGDVMFGRRYYDRNEDGDVRDGLLREGATAKEHAVLLEHVRPLLEDADITVVNYESPVLDVPWFDPTDPRPPAFHSTKEFVFASAPASVDALRESGVDVVSLANNHVNDALGPGLDRTLTLLDRAGIPRFGAGRTVEEAWAPAVVERKGQRFAFLGCTTITGREHPVSYVAEDRHGGAARCAQARLAREVASAGGRADVVVVAIHGGNEYGAEQTAVVRRLTEVARRAGADVVVNGHPHVVGSVEHSRSAVVAETMGNLLFDQQVWPTFLSYLLRVDVRAGAPLAATVDPLLLEDYVPRPTVGLVADSASRRAAGLAPASSPLLVPPGALAGPRAGSTVSREVRLQAGTVARLAPGWWAAAADGGSAAAGEDLLWTGSFEDMDTAPDTAGAHLWALGSSGDVTPDAACSGRVGARLQRSPVSTLDVVVSPRHRQLVTAGSRVSLLAAVRRASPGARLELRWYGDTKGASGAVESVEVPAGAHRAGRCALVRIDAVVPPGVVAAQPFLRLVAPPGVHRGAELAVDDVRLVVWAPVGTWGRRYDTVEARRDVTVTLHADGVAGTVPPGPFAGSRPGRTP
ncbi:MAG: CapA family protein [Actinomycetota bacterium]|nr:CapA family protein [Actinomycetota bacterium]